MQTHRICGVTSDKYSLPPVTLLQMYDVPCMNTAAKNLNLNSILDLQKHRN